MTKNIPGPLAPPLIWVMRKKIFKKKFFTFSQSTKSKYHRSLILLDNLKKISTHTKGKVMTFFAYLNAHTQRDWQSDHDQKVGQQCQNERTTIWRVRGSYLKYRFSLYEKYICRVLSILFVDSPRLDDCLLCLMGLSCISKKTIWQRYLLCCR